MILHAEAGVEGDWLATPTADTIIAGELVQLTSFGGPVPLAPVVTMASAPVIVEYEQVNLMDPVTIYPVVPARWRYRIRPDGWGWPQTPWSGTVTWTTSAGANGRICTGLGTATSSVSAVFAGVVGLQRRDKASTYKTLPAVCKSCCDFGGYP